MNMKRVNGARVVAKSLRKTYAGTNAVDDVDLTIEPGEFMTLLGPSGSGKTTTLSMISGFTEIDGGSLEIDGKRINDVPARERGIGMVFQNYALFPHMTVADNIAFSLKQRRVPKARRKEAVKSALDTVRLDGFESRYPAQLSGGQQQRVAIARAIVFEPRVLLMDEPLGALDRTLRDGMQLEIRRIQREAGSTVVFVTHDQEEALAMSNRIAVFNSGRIEQVGTGAELYDDPSNLFVAKFLGESTLIAGALKRSAGDSAVDHLGTLLRCEGAESLADGSPVTLMLRPERARLRSEDDAVEPGYCAVPVTAMEEVYLGVGRKISIRLPDGTTGMVREAFDRQSQVRPGDRALLTWATRDAKVLQ